MQKSAICQTSRLLPSDRPSLLRRSALLNLEQFSCLAEARVVLEDWRQDYNAQRPHSALGMLAPTAYAASRPSQHTSRHESTNLPGGHPAASPGAVVAGTSSRRRLPAGSTARGRRDCRKRGRRRRPADAGDCFLGERLSRSGAIGRTARLCCRRIRGQECQPVRRQAHERFIGDAPAMLPRPSRVCAIAASRASHALANVGSGLRKTGA